MNSESNFSLPYQNQLQFNLNVPITTDKLAVQFQRPQPIFIERISGHHALPGKQVFKTTENADRRKDNSLLLEDTMSVMTQLARRDIQRGHTQSQIQFSHYEADTKSKAPSSPQHSCQVTHKSSVRRQRLHHPVTVRESEKNRVFGAVQTPPPAKPKALNESVVHLDTNISCVATSQDEFTRLTSEMFNYLQILQNFLERAIGADSSELLVPVGKGKHKDGFLYQEESTGRAQLRAEENKVRCVRTVYNLTQKVKQLQKELLSCDLNNLVKRNHMTSQFVAIYRSSVKSLQMFMSQLPFQKLEVGLPSHYHDLAAMIRSLVGLSHLLDRADMSDQVRSVVTLMDKIDNLNSNWSTEVKEKFTSVDKKPVGQTWVSDTKVDKNIFVTKDRPPAVLVPKKFKNKALKTHFNDHKAQGNKGKENIFNKHKAGPNSDFASKQKQRPATAPSKSQPHSRLLKDNPVSSNMKVSQTVSKNVKDVNFDLGKPTVSVQRYQTKGASPSMSSDYNLNTSSPFYVESLNNEDIRDIFQVKSHREDGSISMTMDSSPQCRETSNLSFAEESRETDISENSRFDMQVSDSDLKAIHSDAVAMCDLPSLENIKLRLMEMQREKQEIQQRWSSFKFFSSSQNLNSKTGKHKSADVHVRWSPETDKDWTENNEFHRDHIEWLVVKEPILFTKPVSRPAPSHSNPAVSEQHFISLLRGKKLLKLKQTSVEKILQNQHQFEKYLKSISHHPSGKFNPWQLIEELSDEILMDCLQEVGKEIESINEEIAHHMFTSEFLVDKSQNEASLLNDEAAHEKVDNENKEASEKKAYVHENGGYLEFPAQAKENYVRYEGSQSQASKSQTSKDMIDNQVSDSPQGRVWNAGVSILNVGETTMMFLDDESVRQARSASVSSGDSLQHRLKEDSRDSALHRNKENIRDSIIVSHKEDRDSSLHSHKEDRDSPQHSHKEDIRYLDDSGDKRDELMRSVGNDESISEDVRDELNRRTSKNDSLEESDNEKAKGELSYSTESGDFNEGQKELNQMKEDHSSMEKSGDDSSEEKDQSLDRIPRYDSTNDERAKDESEERINKAGIDGDADESNDHEDSDVSNVENYSDEFFEDSEEND